MFTFGGPADNIDGLVVFGEGGQVFDLSFGSFRVDSPDADVVVTTSSSKSAFSTGFEVNRVDRRVLLVPIDD